MQIRAIIAAGLALLYYWRHYRLTLPLHLTEPVLGGVLVAVVWVLLVPSDIKQDMAFAGTLHEMGIATLIGWSLFRVTGFLVVIPILEELVFRGYLLGRLSNQEVTTTVAPQFRVVGLVGISLLFGFIHSTFLAGVAAGLILGMVRYRSGTISSCIIAHAVANLIVLIWAAYSGQWSLV